ncbi:WbqC family protein [Candidatus Reidiella endopervernicosa]|uniref:WbqC family protein n=1 Tax=Candidatus Reidiella endopervernicosa TaxID=2738883 RepID=A0A6N0HVF3_9GAMM|nr:WbqC family protein [Candidatus Reidiella endopervernicosa]
MQTIDLIKECLTYESVSLSNWVTNSLVLSCQRLGIAFDYSMFSSMNIDTSDVREPGDWALKIACEAGADEYVNPYGGYSIFSEEKFIERGVSLKFLKPELSSYVQRRGEFVEGCQLSM